MQCFDEDYYRSLGSEERAALLRCVRSGIEHPEAHVGCCPAQPTDYDRFRPFFSKVVAAHHGVDEDVRQTNSWALERVLDVAQLGLPALSVRVRVGRNLEGFAMPPAMTREERCELEAVLVRAFGKLRDEVPQFRGRYVSLTPGHPSMAKKKEHKRLAAQGIMFKDMSTDAYLTATGIAADWPYGRGCYISDDGGFVCWVGEEDHLRVMCTEDTTTVINEVFERLEAALKALETMEGVKFAMSEHYGVVTSSPTELGTGMRASAHVQLPNITADGMDKRTKAVVRGMAKVEALCTSLGLSVRGPGGKYNIMIMIATITLMFFGKVAVSVFVMFLFVVRSSVGTNLVAWQQWFKSRRGRHCGHLA